MELGNEGRVVALLVVGYHLIPLRVLGKFLLKLDKISSLRSIHLLSDDFVLSILGSKSVPLVLLNGETGNILLNNPRNIGLDFI